MTLIELAERVEAAEVGSDDLDRDIMRALGFSYRVERRSIGLTYGKAWDMHLFREWVRGEEVVRESCVPRYTASIDAAMTLVPEGHDWLFNTRGVYSHVWEPKEVGDGYWQARAATPALALCAAALRAQWDTYAKRQDRNGLGPKDSGPVGEADAPKGGSHDPHS